MVEVLETPPDSTDIVSARLQHLGMTLVGAAELLAQGDADSFDRVLDVLADIHAVLDRLGHLLPGIEDARASADKVRECILDLVEMRP